MTDYILIQAQEGKVQLLAKPDHPYRIKFGAYELVMEHWLESWMVYLLYSYERELAVEWLRDTCQDIEPNEIDEFIDIFKSAHPISEIEYSFDLIPHIATNTDNMLMRHELFKGNIAITLPQEEEALHIIRSGDENKFVKLNNWFWRYCKDYGIKTRKKYDREGAHKALAELFCQLHGVQYDRLKRVNKSVAKQSNGIPGFGCLMLSLWCIGALMLIFIGGEKDDGLFGTGTFIGIIGILMLYPIWRMFFNNTKM